MRDRKKKNYSIPTISTPNNHAQRIATTSTIILNLHTTTGLPLAGKEYMCFQMEVKLPRTPGVLNKG